MHVDDTLESGVIFYPTLPPAKGPRKENSLWPHTSGPHMGCKNSAPSLGLAARKEMEELTWPQDHVRLSTGPAWLEQESWPVAGVPPLGRQSVPLASLLRGECQYPSPSPASCPLTTARPSEQLVSVVTTCSER